MHGCPGCTLYAVDVQIRSDPFADTHRRSAARRGRSAKDLRVRLAAVVKKKILTFEWAPDIGDFRDVKVRPVQGRWRVARVSSCCCVYVTSRRTNGCTPQCCRWSIMSMHVSKGRRVNDPTRACPTGRSSHCQTRHARWHGRVRVYASPSRRNTAAFRLILYS